MPTGLRIVPPLPVTDGVLLATDVPESTYPAWNSGTTYALEDRVHIAATHKVYEALTAHTNKPPASNPADWAEVGPTNRWALFDRSNSTQTAQSTSFYYSLAPSGAFNAAGLLNITGGLSIRWRVTHATLGTLLDETDSLASLPAQAGWWEWYYGERRGPTLAIRTDLPGVVGAELRIDVTGTSALAAGVFLFGQAKELGFLVQQGARVGIQDYSRKETNEWGDAVLVQRAFAKRASFEVPVTAPLVDEAVQFLSLYRAIPCLFIGGGRYESTTVYGFLKDWDVAITYSTHSVLSLQLEGLT